MTKTGTRAVMDPLELARQVFAIERDALTSVSSRLDGRFAQACELILAAPGRVVVLGMGKSGLVGRKIVATLSSTGTPSLFVHPGEAFHGDLGMLQRGDVALMISNSGETEEIIRIIPFLQEYAIPIIAFTANASSSLGIHSQCVLDVGVPREACANNLAPTASSTAALVMGDALAVALSTMRGFQPSDFARFHPGGFIGQGLLTRVQDVMHAEALPVCEASAGFRAVARVMSEGGLGLALVMDGPRLLGIVTDGDLRRTLEKSEDIASISAGTMMTRNPKLARPAERFSQVEQRMREHKINVLVVVNEAHAVVGIVQIYDLRRRRP